MSGIKKIQPIHPFAARMAPEIAFNALEGLPMDSLILDPMAGSGTVLRTISSMGYNGIGIDIDPLAVMMTKAGTTTIHQRNFIKKAEAVIEIAKTTNLNSVLLPWIDHDPKTSKFISFWFAKKQMDALRKLSFVLNSEKGKYTGLLKIALSKLIITKTKGASLAADVSHSRPHKVRETNNFDVFHEYNVVCRKLAKIIDEATLIGEIKVSLGDARNLKIKSDSIDAIITSPPYLNAIDYMRGHKLALVWLGYEIDKLSTIRGTSIGAEKAPDAKANIELAKKITAGIEHLENLPRRKIKMIYRYALDMHGVIKEAQRVLKKGARATFVIGNTIQHGIYIENTKIATEIANSFGLELINQHQREIPQNKRYLPPPTQMEASSFKNRMKTEAVLTFQKA